MIPIKIKPPENKNFFDHFVYLYQVLRRIDGRQVFDFRDAKWFFPVVLLPLAAYINDTKSDTVSPINKDVLRYLETISFPKGVEKAYEIKNERTYIPIAHIN